MKTPPDRAVLPDITRRTALRSAVIIVSVVSGVTGCNKLLGNDAASGLLGDAPPPVQLPPHDVGDAAVTTDTPTPDAESGTDPPPASSGEPPPASPPSPQEDAAAPAVTDAGVGSPRPVEHDAGAPADAGAPTEEDAAPPPAPPPPIDEGDEGADQDDADDEPADDDGAEQEDAAAPDEPEPPDDADDGDDPELEP